MQTIEITIEDATLVKLDRVISELSLTRTAFVQQSLEAALRRQEVLEQERRHAQGYARHPVQADEFDGWEKARVWE